MISPTPITQTSLKGSIDQHSVKGSPVQAATPASIKNWTTGQILKATVMQQLSNTTLLLKIGNTQLTAKTEIPLSKGSELQLKVINKGEQPLLKIIRYPNSKVETNLTALRQAIPKQAPLSELFANLKLVDQRLPQVIQQAIQTIQAGMTSRMDLLNPEGIKKALIESGTFLESNIKNSESKYTVESDLKGKLLRLAHLLMNEHGTQKQSNTKNNLLSLLADNKAMPDLQRHVESALAKIQLNQLNSLPNAEQNSQAFLLELPVKENEHVDVFSLKINEEDQTNSDQESSKRWSIKLSFDLDGLGKIHAKLLLGGEQIQASLWAEEEVTFELIQTNLEQLRKRLTDVEFIDPEVKCYKGKPETDTPLPSDYNELIHVKV